MENPILEGSLSAVSVPDLLTFINMMKKTGVLVLRQGEVVRRVYWDRGEMIFASSSDPEEALGSFLVRHGKITQEENMRSGMQVEPGRRQGKILVQMGVLTPKELWWAVKNQVLEIIYAAFSIRSGHFAFEETEAAHEEKIKLSVSTTNIIMEGIRRLDEWPRIREVIPSNRVVPRPAPPEQRDRSVKFLEGEQAILDLVDGVRTVRDIIHLSELDEFETLRILMALCLARYILIPGAREGRPGEEVEDATALEALVASYNRIFARILSSLGARLPEGAVEEFCTGVLAEAKSPCFEGVSFDGGGRLDVKALLANVADLPADERQAALDGALSNLLSFVLFEASRHLSPEEKAAVYRMAGERTTPLAQSGRLPSPRNE